MEKRRIHIAGVGHREVERVVKPARELKADLVYLLANPPGVVGDPRAVGHRESIRKQLAAEKIEVDEVSASLWDAPSVARAARTIVEKHPEGEFRFNASTGPKPCVIGGFLASMFWRIRVYYANVDYGRERSADHESQYPVTDVVFLPTFRSETPRLQVIEGLAAIKDSGGRIAQADLLQDLLKRRVIRSKIEDQEISPQAAHSQLQSILARLDLLGFIERGTALTKGGIGITPEGQAGLRLFGNIEG